MMSGQIPNLLFDPSRRNKRHARAIKQYKAGNDFLLAHAANDLAERLKLTVRDFKNGLALFGGNEALAAALMETGKIQSITRLEESIDDVSLEALSLEPQNYDIAASAFSLHWSNDLPGSLIQIFRALKPDGLFTAIIPGNGTLEELREAFLIAESELFGGAGTRIDPFPDVRTAGQLLQRAGFALPVTDVETLTIRYDSALALMQDLRAMGATSVLNQPVKPISKELLTRVNTIYADKFSDPDGRVRATFSLIALSGWTPHESQQKPLQPGSAKMRLSDALGKNE